MKKNLSFQSCQMEQCEIFFKQPNKKQNKQMISMESNNKTLTKAVNSGPTIQQSINKQHFIELDDDMDNFMGRSNTMNTVHHVEVNSQEEMKKLIINLQKLLKEANHQKMQLQQKLQQHINRSIKRENQFYRIINNYVAKTNYLSQPFNTTGSLEEDTLKNLYSQLMDRLQQIDQKLQSKYQNLYEENLKIMERKITGLTEKMQKELKKSKQITNDQTGEMKSMMVKLGDMAVEVEGRNGELVKKNNELELKVQMLSEEKRLLLEQIFHKKNLLRNFHSKCKIYEARLKQNHSNNIQLMTGSNNKHNNCIQSISKKKSISQASNINSKPFNEYAAMTMSSGLNDKGGVVSHYGSRSNNQTIHDFHPQKKQKNLIPRNFSVNTNHNNKITSYSQYKKFKTHKKSTQLNKIINQKTIQQSEDNMQIFSTSFVTSHDIIKLEKVRNQRTNNVGRKSEKDYVSSLTMARTNTPIQQHGHSAINNKNNKQKFISQKTVTNNNNKLTTSTTQQSSNQVFFFREERKNSDKNTDMKVNKEKQVAVDGYDGNKDIEQLVNNKKNGCCCREMNAVNSIRNVVNREKHKKLQYMSRLTQLQRKLTAIDGLVSDALIKLSGMDAEVTQHRNGNREISQQQEGSSREQILSFGKVLCDQLKNIIATNYNSSNLSLSNITQNQDPHNSYPNENGYYPVTINNSERGDQHITLSEKQKQQPQQKQITTAQLIKLLDGELMN